MRVLHCVNFFHPSVGGTQLATYYLAKHLVHLGVDVKIVTFNVSSLNQFKNGYFSVGLPRFEQIEGIPVYRFPVLFLGKTRGSQPRYKIMVSPSALKMVLHERPDIIHFQGANEVLQAIMTSMASSGSRSKRVLTTHGLYAQVELFRKHQVSKWINELLLRVALEKMDHVIALSTHERKILNDMQVSYDKVSVISNGIDLARFQAYPSHPQTHKPNLASPFILCVTRIRENKGIEALIHAAAHVVSKRPDVKFVLVGNCSQAYAVKLKGLAKKLKVEANIIFKGYIPHESNTLLELYRDASIFVLPSLMESLPLVLLEAMASGVPIVASRVGGIPDLVTPSDGILVAPNDVTELSSSLLYLLENEDARMKLGQHARKTAENYSWRRVAEKTVSTYQKMLAA